MIKHVYIHIPFCLRKCGYCSFYSVVYDKELVAKYVDVLCREIETSPLKTPLPPFIKGGVSCVETIYFGGGTPSLLKPFEIEKVLSKFDLSGVKEITLEVNPATHNSTTPNPSSLERNFWIASSQAPRNDKRGTTQPLLTSPTWRGSMEVNNLRDYRDLGINRLSIGTQSMKDTELKFLGRVHKVQDVISLYEKGLSDVFDNISHDYIYGLPHQKLSDVEYSIKEIIKLKPSHVSIYNLSLDENVPLYKYVSQLPDDELVSDMYFLIRDMMLGSGYVQYELSSFCLPGKESLHNLSYWSSVDYLGIGAGACGYVDGWRYENDGLEGYMVSINKIPPTPLYKGGGAVGPLEKGGDATEYIITGLRKTAGISLADYEKRFGHSFTEKYSELIKKMLEKGLIEVDSSIRLCPEYYFISNEVLCEFV